MSKNALYHRFAITISYPSGYIELEPMKAWAIDFCKPTKQNKLIRTAWVHEMGKNGDHPHLHFLVEHSKPKRRLDYEKSILSKILKTNEMIRNHPDPDSVASRLVDVKCSYNPLYWFDKYMTKENDPIVNGFDIKEMKSELRKAQRRHYRMGGDLIPLTRKNLIIVLEETIPLFRQFNPLSYNLLCRSTFNQYVMFLKKSNYDVLWIGQNLKLTQRAIGLVENGEISIFSKDFEDII